MAKPFTLYGSTGLSKDSGKSSRSLNRSSQSPSEKALRFVLDYAKSTTTLRSKTIPAIHISKN